MRLGGLSKKLMAVALSSVMVVSGFAACTSRFRECSR